MDTIDLNLMLDRNNIITNITNFLENFEKNKNDLTIKRGIYIYGPTGSGKTYFINSLLKSLNYDIITYDAGDVRNKSIIDTISNNNMTDNNVLSLLQKKAKSIAIVMDEIDGMNNGDKGGINSLIKIMRPKKTKKQKLEEVCYIPIICIGNNHVDKKINELIKISHSICFKSPTDLQINNIIKKIMPSLSNKSEIINNLINYVQNDLGKLNNLTNIYYNNSKIFNNPSLFELLIPKSFSEDSKETTKKLINNSFDFKMHNLLISETDRTIIGLLWHENIVDYIEKYIKKEQAIPIYLELLENISYADYVDRITFQKQIWLFNEISSLIKVFYNNFILKNKFENNSNTNKNKNNITSIRFTKVLTKYSTEYNNLIFIQNLCQILSIDKKDLFSYFINLKNNNDIEKIYEILEQFEITKLDINRIYRYLDRFYVNQISETEVSEFE